MTEPVEQEAVVEWDELDQFFDALVKHGPLTPDERHVMTKEYVHSVRYEERLVHTLRAFKLSCLDSTAFFLEHVALVLTEMRRVMDLVQETAIEDRGLRYKAQDEWRELHETLQSLQVWLMGDGDRVLRYNGHEFAANTVLESGPLPVWETTAEAPTLESLVRELPKGIIEIEVVPNDPVRHTALQLPSGLWVWKSNSTPIADEAVITLLNRLTADPITRDELVGEYVEAEIEANMDEEED